MNLGGSVSRFALDGPGVYLFSCLIFHRGTFHCQKCPNLDDVL